jgi:hypothetical protein
LAHQNVADTIVGNRKIALPVRVAAVRFRQTLSDDKAGGVGFQGFGEIALAYQNVADLVVGNG